MGIDVITSDLASLLRGMDRGTAAAFRRREHHLLTREGSAEARRSASPQGAAGLHAAAAYLLARKLAGELGTKAGNPWADIGEVFELAVDRMYPRWWAGLHAVAVARKNDVSLETALAELDPEDGALFEHSFWDAHWDGFPGVGFARAVTGLQTLVVPLEEHRSFAVGAFAVSTLGEGRAFLAALADHLALPAAHFGVDHDPDMPEPLRDLLYHPRLFTFHLGQVASTRRPLAVFG